MRRVSSRVSTRAAPAGASFPLISTSGGFPGEKKRSLIFGEVLSIAANSSGVENGATAAAAVPADARGAEGTTFGTTFVGEDIEGVPPFRIRDKKRWKLRWGLRDSAALRLRLRVHTESWVRKVTEGCGIHQFSNLVGD
jgi:F0F1-type ATP synthase membrane subunit c/vacuolar-type H+-ATPase subunit K